MKKLKYILLIIITIITIIVIIISFNRTSYIEKNSQYDDLLYKTDESLWTIEDLKYTIKFFKDHPEKNKSNKNWRENTWNK